MAFGQMILETDSPAVIITLSRPEKLKAFTNQLGRGTRRCNPCL